MGPRIKTPSGPFFKSESSINGIVVSHVGAPYHLYGGSYASGHGACSAGMEVVPQEQTNSLKISRYKVRSKNSGTAAIPNDESKYLKYNS
ncbi:hypothetical protein TNCV_3691431 [Trichonephila clavipes]|nr:hypothetical protein TNCV_3691431 [Trichonephila clavipes]